MYTLVPLYPGETFADREIGTWVAPASGHVLLRVNLVCDVPYWSDVEHEGCSNDDGLHCEGDGDTCGAGLTLTVTSGAYVSEAGEIRVGRATSETTISLARLELEAQIAAMFAETPEDQRRLAAPPTLPEMLVSGTKASDMLAEHFTSEQLPHIIFPTAIEALTTATLREEQNGGHPDLSDSIVAVEDAVGVRVSLTAVSPSQQESEAALASLTTEEGQHRGCTKQQAVPSGGAHRRQLETDGDVEELEARVAEKEKELEALRQSLAAARNQSV